jgi:hypothetical protein
MPPEQQRQAPKWKQAVNTVDWLTTQIQPGTQVQIFAFTDKLRRCCPAATVSGSRSRPAASSMRRHAARDVSEGPTSLHVAHAAARMFEPKADNIYLLTDGL